MKFIEKTFPFRIDRSRVFGIAPVKLGDKIGVRAVKKGRLFEIHVALVTCEDILACSFANAK